MLIKNHKLSLFHDAHVALDGQQKEINLPDKPVQIIFVPYVFSGKTRITIAKNIQSLKLVIEVVNNAIQYVNKAANPSSDGRVPTENLESYIKSRDEILNSESEVNLIPISEDEFLLDKNMIPSSILAILLDIKDADKK